MLKLLNGFGAAHWAQIDQQIRQALKEIREFAGAERCEFLEVSASAEEATLMYRAGAEHSSTTSAARNLINLAPWMFEKLVQQREPVVFCRREALPPEAAHDLGQLERTCTGAGLYIPFELDGDVRYVLGLADRGERRAWAPHLVQQLAAVGRLLVTALGSRALSAAHSQVQEQLIAAQQFSQATLDALHEHVTVIDALGAVVRTSGACAALDAGIGGVFGRLAIGSDYLLACEAVRTSVRVQARRLARSIRSALSGESRRCDVDLVLPGAGDKPRWIRSSVRRVEVGGAVYAVISHEDFTERRTREQELQLLRTHQWHSDRVVQTGVIIGSLAHELSQPVTAILANAQTSLRLLSRAALGQDENRQILTDIVADCKRAGAVIESLRITLRRQKTERRAQDVSEIVQQVVRLLNTELISQRVDVKMHCLPGCAALVDRAQIQQVLINLIMNAIEAMPLATVAARRLWLNVTHTQGSEVLISLRDNGVGITPEQLGKVFEAFWTTKARGTGMGLSICRAIVEAHGGRIWVKRNKVGSTFSVALPAEAGVAGAAAAVAS